MDKNKQNQGRERETGQSVETLKYPSTNTIKTTAEYDHSSRTNEQFSLGFLSVK